VPVGAVVWHEGRIVGRGANRPITSGDPTAHAEIVAIRRAASATGNYRLTGAVLAVTLEPCLMCFGAGLAARGGGGVFGAPPPARAARGWARPRGRCVSRKVPARSTTASGSRPAYARPSARRSYGTSSRRAVSGRHPAPC